MQETTNHNSNKYSKEYFKEYFFKMDFKDDNQISYRFLSKAYKEINKVKKFEKE